MDCGARDLTIDFFRRTIWHYLDQDALETAAFTVERLFAVSPGDAESRHLAGLVYYRMGRFQTAMSFTYNTYDLGCLYIYAKSCYKLKEYILGIAALESGHALLKYVSYRDHDDGSERFKRMVLPTTSMVCVLLAHMYKATGMDKKAILHYAMGVRLDPFCWEATESLCQMGVNIKIPTLYAHISARVFPGHETQQSGIVGGSFANHLSSKWSTDNSASIFSQTGLSETHFQSNNGLQTSQTTRGSSFPAPSPSTWKSGLDTPSQGRPDPIKNSWELRSSAEPFTTLRRSSRLAAAASSNSPAETPARFTPNTGLKRSDDTQKQSPFKKVQRLTSDTDNALRSLTDLYMTLTLACLQFYKFQCNDALNTLAALPLDHANTPWVLAKQARLYFEKVQYAQSLECFEKLHQADRYRIQDMEYYSTLLWHLHREVDLTFLACDLIAIDRHAPQAWCAVGNALSLTKDTDNALKCFQRAVLLDPNMTYAFTLQAHEQVASDAYDQALDCYRLALRVDKRHYNAWYGIGMVFLRLGENTMAELHFRKAISINPENVVLLCCIGMVLEKMNRHDESLVQYSRAIQYQSSSALSLYKRARLLVKMGQYRSALDDLGKLVALAPDEASVHFLLGQIYKIMHNRVAAVREFTIALNLDPKGSHLIKEALEGLEGHTGNNRGLGLSNNTGLQPMTVH